MTAERSEASDMFAKQEREREQFLIDQADKLNDAGFDWAVPESFAKRQNYHDKGLVMKDGSGQEAISQRISKVLKPNGELILVIASGKEILIAGSLISITDANFFAEVERMVDKTLADLQAEKVPA